jgi:small subunit ribosomal protein S11e
MAESTIGKEKTYPRRKGVRLNPYGEDTKEAQRCRNIGLGFSTPDTAAKGTYIDKKCPFRGEVAVRGRIIKGEVIKMKQEKTIVVMKRYLHYHRKYKRYERRNTKFNVHLSPCFFGLVNAGDMVTIAEVRPISKTKRFVVVDYEKKRGGDEFKVLHGI